MRQQLARRSLPLGFALAGVVLAPLAADAAVLAPTPGCYVIVDPKDPPDLDHAEEVLCVDASGKALIRESFMFGEGVKGCNIVTISPRGDKLVIDIDYRNCTNEAPSHQLVCLAATSSGSFACTNTLTSEKADSLAVKLAPLPPGQ